MSERFSRANPTNEQHFAPVAGELYRRLSDAAKAPHIHLKCNLYHALEQDSAFEVNPPHLIKSLEAKDTQREVHRKPKQAESAELFRNNVKAHLHTTSVTTKVVKRSFTRIEAKEEQDITCILIGGAGKVRGDDLLARNELKLTT